MFKIVENEYYTINDLDKILNEAQENGICKTTTKQEYWNIIFAFDIETTSFIGHATKGDLNSKRSIMYIWQLAINGRVIVGREWSEFLYCINNIVEFLGTTKDKRIIIYVHNLAFEFQYIRKLFTWKKVFAIDTRKPIYAITDNGIEFRCSYILTNYSLAKLGEQLKKYKVSKMVGDLDYSVIRTPLTPLTDKEMQYCINDVLVVSAYIKECAENERSIARIPYTATGYCRRYVRRNCLYKGGAKHWREQFQKYHNFIQGLKITDEAEYMQLKRAFQGGYTHCSANYSMTTSYNVDSIDFTSSYPYCLLSELYPMGTGRIVNIHSNKELEYYLKYYCCVFDCEIFGLEASFKYENYISDSKCYESIDAVLNNGRIQSAWSIKTTLTNIDFEIIRRTYKMKKCNIYNFRIYEKGYLPIEIIESIIKLYQDKTTLKGVEGKEQEYQNAKALLNAIYGMMVTDIVRDDIIYTDAWGIEKADPKKQIDKYNRSRKRFNFYAWGVFCTAYARRNLWTGILEFGKDYIYADTDSIKSVNFKDHINFVENYNRTCEIKLRRMCKHYNLDYEKELLPKTIEGEIKPLGVFDHDGHYERFKSIGAKRYMTYSNGKLSITISGVNKKTAIPFLIDNYSVDDCFLILNEGFSVPAEASGKLTHYYIDNEYSGTLTDYQGIKYKYHALSGIYLEPAEYEIGDMSKYLEFLKGYFYTK